MSSTPRTSSPRQPRRQPDSPVSNDGMVQQMKDYVEQVVIICQTMLAFLQARDSQDAQAGSTDVEFGASAATGTSSKEDDENTAFLKHKLKELVGMNVSWQQTHQVQERRIVELEEQVRHLLQTRTQDGGSGFTDQQQADIDRQFLDQKNKYRQLEDEKCRLEEQNYKYQHDFIELTERVQLLDMQLVTNREDFECERKDRERAQSRVAELEQELEKYRNRSAPQPIPYQPIQYHQPSQYQPSQFCGLRQNDWTNPRRFMVDAHDGYDEADCVADSPVVARGMSASPVAGRSPGTTEEPLQCPNCRRTFTRDQHADLMDHMDRCDSRSMPL